MCLETRWHIDDAGNGPVGRSRSLRPDRRLCGVPGLRRPARTRRIMLGAAGRPAHPRTLCRAHDARRRLRLRPGDRGASFENPLYFEHVNLTPLDYDPFDAIWRARSLISARISQHPAALHRAACLVSGAVVVDEAQSSSLALCRCGWLFGRCAGSICRAGPKSPAGSSIRSRGNCCSRSAHWRLYMPRQGATLPRTPG